MRYDLTFTDLDTEGDGTYPNLTESEAKEMLSNAIEHSKGVRSLVIQIDARVDA